MRPGFDMTKMLRILLTFDAGILCSVEISFCVSTGKQFHKQTLNLPEELEKSPSSPSQWIGPWILGVLVRCGPKEIGLASAS